MIQTPLQNIFKSIKLYSNQSNYINQNKFKSNYIQINQIIFKLYSNQSNYIQMNQIIFKLYSKQIIERHIVWRYSESESAQSTRSFCWSEWFRKGYFDCWQKGWAITVIVFEFEGFFWFVFFLFGKLKFSFYLFSSFLILIFILI